MKVVEADQADSQLSVPGAKKPCTVLGGGEIVPPGLVEEMPTPDAAPTPSVPTSSSQMTSKDYYFDSYSHFGQFLITPSLWAVLQYRTSLWAVLQYRTSLWAVLHPNRG